MAFVKMQNLLGEKIRVPKGSVGMFKNLGFVPEEEDADKAVVGQTNFHEEEDIEEPVQEEKSEDELFVEKVIKKPLTSWNKDEVKRYAAIYNIDLTGTKNVNEAKDRIKAFMADAE